MSTPQPKTLLEAVCELARAIGVSQKSAWHMLHRIRKAMDEAPNGKMEGVTESDETFVGGKFRNMHKSKRDNMPKGRGTVGKAVVHGILQRGDDDKLSQVRVNVVPNQKRATLHAEIIDNVKAGIVVYTDALPSYEGLQGWYIHEMIDHACEYVRGEVHTNGMENFWALLKRCLGGTYVAVAPQHLVRYCAEEAFRFNQRDKSDGGRFQAVMKNTPGKRLTWDRLTSKDEVATRAPMKA